MQPPRRCRVITAWTASYTPALAVRRGDRLNLGSTDPDNPGWRWAKNADGLGGWLPVTMIDGDKAAGDFDSTELSATPCDGVHIIDTIAGWHLCRTPSGKTGWLPATHLGPPDPLA
jgi:hypothetical protein